MELKWLPFASEQLKVVAEYVKENFGETIATEIAYSNILHLIYLI